MSQMINVIYEDNHLIVVEKPINVPVQEDESHDLDFLSMVKAYIKNKYNKQGNVYIGLLHRLDRPVGGLMVFAKTSKCAKRLSEQIRNRIFQKTYLAVVEGTLSTKGTLKDHLLKDSKTNIVKVDPHGKEAILDYELIAHHENLSLVKIDLKTGRSHQIRVQFSNNGNPLYGDQKYNPNSKKGEQIALFSHSVTFNHPITDEQLHFKLSMPKSKPWNLFQNVN